MKELLENLCRISKAVGERKDYTQGGGGNTSVKLDAQYMAVKASGCLLRDMTPKSGFTVVDYQKVLAYQQNPDAAPGADHNKIQMDLALASRISVNGEPLMRPSVEMGFHAALKKYVVHTHSVYATYYACIEGGAEEAKKLLESEGLKTVIAPYVNPGFYLCQAIDQQIRALGTLPDIVLMKNHGIVATADDADECLAVHEKANAALRRDMMAFPSCDVEEKDGAFVSKTAWLREVLRDKAVYDCVFHRAYYPDQLVYLKGLKEGEDFVLSEDGMIYHKSEAEARAIDETLTAVAYVVYHAHKNGRELAQMQEESVRYINNWDSEKYRKELLSK